MTYRSLHLLPVALLLAVPLGAAPPDRKRPYRLESIDLKQRVIWGATCREPEGGGLAFGGQDQEADDGRPHTRILVGGTWKRIDEDLRRENPLQALHDQTWALRGELKDLRARLRHLYFEGRPPDEEADALGKSIAPDREKLMRALSDLTSDLSRAGPRAGLAAGYLKQAGELLVRVGPAVEADAIRSWRNAQIALELAAEALDAEPAPRALDCGRPQRKGDTGPPARGLVYDAKTGVYVLFGGDHLDYLMNDTWVFDPRKRRWRPCRPPGAPPPRANHRLEAPGDGTVRLAGGYTYASNTDYCGGQYADLDDGTWTYDIEKDAWSGATLVPPDSRTYRTGPFHPDFYLQGPKPDAAAFASTLDGLPANRWVATDPPYRPRLNRDWGCARIDPSRDLMLRWSGGHSAHGGTDVPHFHFATNRWELAFPVEFPLGQLYANTRYPDGFNFNRRPWMTGHTYQNYAVDPPSGKLVKAGRPRHWYLYDPGAADWTGRGIKPEAMRYGSCFYTLTLVATPRGALCWDKNGKIHLFDHGAGRWRAWEVGGDQLPGAYVDHSSIAYDSKRDRVLMLNAPGYGKPYEGRIWALDLGTRSVEALRPSGCGHAHRFAYVDRCAYDPVNDLLVLATPLKEAGDRTRTPAYDCAKDRWVTLDVAYAVKKRGDRIERAFPHGRSCGLMHDPERGLLWGTDTNSQVYVLRLDAPAADPRPLGSAR